MATQLRAHELWPLLDPLGQSSLSLSAPPLPAITIWHCHALSFLSAWALSMAFRGHLTLLAATCCVNAHFERTLATVHQSKAVQYALHVMHNSAYHVRGTSDCGLRDITLLSCQHHIAEAWSMAQALECIFNMRLFSMNRPRWARRDPGWLPPRLPVCKSTRPKNGSSWIQGLIQARQCSKVDALYHQCQIVPAIARLKLGKADTMAVYTVSDCRSHKQHR